MERIKRVAVKNYSPTLLKVFEAGSKPPYFRFECESEKAAKTLQWRLHNLRREMRKERHWLLPVAEGVVITAKGNLLIARPPDMDVEEQLKRALEQQAPEVMKDPPALQVIKPKSTGIEDYLKGNNKEPKK